ncbi:hypothetical protein E4T56_gene273 [Termitomyces sp. T112]|nr:hypothetical protein E4T56_gene273 [Termitomyces sp. T112]
MGKSIMADTLAEYIAKRKWGCTCGACAGGWLSKSIRSKLSLVTYESLDVSHSCQLETFHPRVQHPNPDALMLIRDFPPELRRSVFLTFYAGCQGIFEAVLKFLDETDEPLSVVAILACTSNDTSVKPFFTQGGRIEHVLDSITRWAMSRVLRGDDMGFEYEWLDEKKGKNEVLCANDLEFSLVRERLGHSMLCFLPDGDDRDDSGEQDDDDDDEVDCYF